MKIYFSQVPNSDIDTYGDEGLLGPNKAGEFFYNSVEFGTNPGGTEEVSIADGCNRYMPISIENLPELISALTVIYNTKTQMDLLQQVTAIAESDAEGYVNEDRVYFDKESVQDIVNSIRY
jgi:hypothetical protein